MKYLKILVNVIFFMSTPLWLPIGMYCAFVWDVCRTGQYHNINRCLRGDCFFFRQGERSDPN